MTLHEAIVKLIRQTGRPMTTAEIANELNKNKWYQKKDGSPITPYQIHGRTKNYPGLFKKDGSIVSLNEQYNFKAKSHKEATFISISQPKKISEISDNSTLIEKVLLNEKNYKSANSIDSIVPNEPGLYCIRITKLERLPAPFDMHLKNRGHNILYIGIAKNSLRTRFLNQELRANGHGTFFRSIGAVLGFRPVKGSLNKKANKQNYTFKPDDEQKIINWININLIVNWVAFKGDFEGNETGIIQRHLPLLNIAKNPMALSELIELRAECVRIANS